MIAQTIEACCKINLGLHVLRKRDDGFHEIETVLYPVPWCDVVHFEPAARHSFTCSDPGLPTDDSNLCVRARLAFEKRFGATDPVKVHLEKRVPYGSGLGGGSSDAAAVLRYLAESMGIERQDERLHQLAGEIGSDVPFFLLDGPALATGRGEVLEPLALDFPYRVVIAAPDVPISTADAYAGVSPRVDKLGLAAKSKGLSETVLSELVTCDDALSWRSTLTNDFEEFVYGAFPQLERIKSTMYGAGAVYASLSGSGSAIFGLFSDSQTAESAVGVLNQRRIHGWAGDQGGGTPF